MSNKQLALKAIQDLPEDTDFNQIMREIAFITGIEEAREEIDEGKGMNSSEAKQFLKECISG